MSTDNQNTNIIPSPIKNLENTNRVINIKRTTSTGNESWRELYRNIVNSVLDDKANTESFPMLGSTTVSGTEYTYITQTGTELPSVPSENIYYKLNKEADSFVVSDNVFLLLENDISDIKINNKLVFPIQDIVKGTSGLLEQASKSSNGTVALISKIAGTALSSIPYLYNLTQLVGKLEGETTNQFYPWIQNLPTWEPSIGNILSFNYKFDFRLGQYGLWDARKEVMLPILNLLTPVLPRYLTSFSIGGPFPGMMQMLGKTLESTFSIDFLRDLFGGETRDGKVPFLSNYENYSYTVSFGKFLTLNNVLIKDAIVTLGREVDDQGWPITGSITLTFQSILPMALTAKYENSLSVRFGS